MEEYQKQFKSNISEITRGNPNNKSKNQLNTIKYIKNLYKSREEVIKLFNDYLKLDLKLCTKQNMEQDLKY